MFLRVSSPKVSYFKPQVGFLASHESDITFTIYNRVQIHNLNKKKLKIIYSIKKKRNKPKFSSSSTQKCQTLGRSPNLRTKRVCLDNIINDLICCTLSFATYITMKSYKEPKKTSKFMSSKWVQCISNWMEAFGAHFDLSRGSNLIISGWVRNLDELQVNFELISGRRRSNSK